MRYGICTDPGNLQLLEELGYSYIEMSVTKTMKQERAVQEEYRRMLASSPVKCEAFNILFPKTMPLLSDTSKEELKSYLHQAMTLIQSYGAGIVVFGSGKCRNCPDGMPFEEAFRRLVEVYQITGEIAASYGVTVVIEPLSHSETNMIHTMAEGAMLQHCVDRKNVQLLSDFYHVMSNRDDLEDIARIAKFGHIHVASADGRKYPVSEENEQYRTWMHALKTAGYQGRISIEGKTEDMKADGAAALALLKKLEAEA